MKAKRRQPPAPKKPGIASHHVHDTYSKIPEDNLKKGHVLFLYLQNGKVVSRTIQALSEQVPGTLTSANHMKPLIKRFDSFRNLSRECEKKRFVNFCEESFYSTYQQEPERSNPESENASTSSYQQESESPSSEPEIASASSHHQQEQETLPTETESVPYSCATPASFRTRLRYNLTPKSAKVQEPLDYVTKQRSAEKTSYRRKIIEYKSKVKFQKVNKIKYLTQIINRKNASLASLKVKNAKLILLHLFSA